MAITSGAGPHSAWLIVNGTSLPIEHGSVSQQAKRQSSSFTAAIPMSYPGAADVLSTLGENVAIITVVARGQPATLLTGEVDAAEYDYIGRVIRVNGRDKSTKLHSTKTSEKWLNKKPSEIVTDVIGRVGLAGNIDASPLIAGKRLEADHVKLSNNITLAQVIHKLSQFDGARWWVTPDGQFHYVMSGSAQASYSLFVNQNSVPLSSDCVHLRVTRNVQAGKTQSVTVKSWHPKKKQVFSSTSNVPSKGGSGSTHHVYDVPGLEQDHVDKHAKSQASEKARHELTVHATVIGDPSVSAGMALQLNGTNYFDQAYEIDSVQHEFGMSGYTTSITARSAKQGRTAS